MITTEQGQKLADELKMKYIETSALTGDNIDEAFFSLARILVKDWNPSS